MSNLDEKVRIGKHDYPVPRMKLRAWLELESIRDDLLQSVKSKNVKGISSAVLSYVSKAVPLTIENLLEYPWYEVAKAFVQIYRANFPDENLPFIRPHKQKKEKAYSGFDYPGRSWYLWAHMIADAYGWQLEYIAELEVNDAIALIQEILVDEQEDREWSWSLSEVAYSYDKASKKSKFNPLRKPEWMMPIRKEQEIKKVKIRASEMPMGLILRWDDGKSTQPQ